MKRARLASLLAIVALSTVGGCGLLRRGPANDVPRTLLYFTNESLDQADVYAVSPGSETTRIGTVMAGRTDTLVVPASVVGRGEVSVIARLLARSITPTTGRVALQPGDRLQIRLPPDQRTLVVLPARP